MGPHRGQPAAFENGTGRLTIMHRTGSCLRCVTAPGHPFPDGQMSWSPDGTWILARGPERLELIDVASGLILRLGFFRGLLEPAWKPGS
jgi:hypothetical protein